MDEQNENEQPAEAPSSPSPTPVPPEAESAAPARVPRASSGNRLQTIITLSILAIVVLVILGTLTPLKNIVTQHFSGPSPTPVATLVPGDNKFYIATGPAWGTVSIDGHPLSRLPVFGQDPPLQLSRGAHIITWHADPFQPESCTVYVPSLIKEPCPYENTSPGNPRTITFTASLANLPTSQRASLVAAAQAALNRFAATTTLQPGELYVRLVPPQSVGTGTAQQALQASEHFSLDTDPNSGRSCNPYSGVVCSSAIGPGNSNCIQFCTFTTNFEPGAVQPGAKSSTAWETMGLFYSTWDYHTLSGQSVAKGQPDTTELDNVSDDYPVYFDIQWLNQKWRVTVNNTSPSFFAGVNPVSQNPACQSIHDQATQVLDGCMTLDTNYLACTSMQVLVSNNTTYMTTQNASKTSVNWSFLAGQNVADGCVAVIVPQQQTVPPASTPQVAYCLYRFGVLLAANALAHRYWPDLPVADAYEQQIAQQVAASEHL